MSKKAVLVAVLVTALLLFVAAAAGKWVAQEQENSTQPLNAPSAAPSPSATPTAEPQTQLNSLPSNPGLWKSEEFGKLILPAPMKLLDKTEYGTVNAVSYNTGLSTRTQPLSRWIIRNNPTWKWRIYRVGSAVTLRAYRSARLAPSVVDIVPTKAGVLLRVIDARESALNSTIATCTTTPCPTPEANLT